MNRCGDCARPNDNGYATCDPCDDNNREQRRRDFVAAHGEPKSCAMCRQEMPPWREDTWCDLCAGAYENTKLGRY